MNEWRSHVEHRSLRSVESSPDNTRTGPYDNPYTDHAYTNRHPKNHFLKAWAFRHGRVRPFLGYSHQGKGVPPLPMLWAPCRHPGVVELSGHFPALSPQFSPSV